MRRRKALLLALHQPRQFGATDRRHQEETPESSSLSKTSFDNSRPLAVNDTEPLTLCRKPAATKEFTCGSNLPAALPYFFDSPLRSTPRHNLSPRNNSSSIALSSVASVRVSGAPASNFSSESVVAKRTAHDPPRLSIECASTPKPMYGSLVQYLTLCFDSCPARAKFDISHCRIPAAFSRSQA